MLDIRLMSALRRGGASLALGAAVLTAACGDSELFGGGGGNTDADPPEITEVIADPAPIRAGETLRLEITATGERLIERANVRVQAGPTTIDTSFAFTTPSLEVNQTFTLDMPATLSGTEVRVTVTVEDDRGTRSIQVFLDIPIEDSNAPAVTIQRPIGPEQTVDGDTSAVGTGATLRVEARVTDESGISEVRFIGLAFRGDAELGTDTIVVRFSERVVEFPRPGTDTLPTDTVIRRDLPQVGDSTETVRIIVQATDLFGNISSDTVPVIVGGPDVQILRPSENTTHAVTADLTIRVAINDPAGIQSATLNLAGDVAPGVRTIALPISGLPVSDTITYLLTAANITGTGEITISATGRNARGIAAPSAPVTVDLVTQQTADENAPLVTLEVDPLPRLSAPLPRVELLDTLEVTVEADDQGGVGVDEIGVIIDYSLNAGGSSNTLQFISTFAPRSNPDFTIRIPVRMLYDSIAATLAESVPLPDSIDIQVSGYAIDASNNADTVNIATGSVGPRGFLLTVAGYTARLPGRGIISDAVIDTVDNRERLFLSNFTQSRVDVLNLSDTTFVPGGILAGAQPWGLFIDLTADTLIVANSGGTNLSKVDLTDAGLNEVVSERVHTPEAVIYQFNRETDDVGFIRYTYFFQGYSDRPQFVAQSHIGSLLYSTVPTDAAEDGTIRLALKQPGWDEYEVYFLFPGGDPSDEGAEDAFLVLNVDRLVVETTTGQDDNIRIIDHVPGFPNMIIDVVGPETTVFDDARAAGSDVVKCAGALNFDAVAVQDTTFVAASGNREWIAFGEGATAEEGRIIMFDGATTQPLDARCLPTGQSHEVQIFDLIHNAAERVTGLGLNENGTLGVARGDFAAYFFDRALRLEGTFSEGINPGGFGAALHPEHTTESSGSDETTLSFVGTAESTIKIIDTYHFFARGEIPIRDPIVGPLRVTLPLPGRDNVGLTCPGDDRCVVAKLFGVTQSAGATQPDGVVIVNVREGDID